VPQVHKAHAVPLVPPAQPESMARMVLKASLGRWVRVVQLGLPAKMVHPAHREQQVRLVRRACREHLAKMVQ
jgi:hypothetical protein